MWPFNDRKIRHITPFRAYCRGRVRPVLDAAEVERYLSADLPVVIGFVLGSIDSEKQGEPLPTEAEVALEVERRFTPPRAPGVGLVEVVVGKGRGGDDGGSGSAPAAAAAEVAAVRAWFDGPVVPPSPAG